MTMQLICDGYRYEIEDDWLTITHSESEVVRLPLVPDVEGERPNAGEWQQVSLNHF
ncbi:MAG: hypothetical protein HY318_01765, partial [Armatimonadetes bacterium]|nr:hypothetical protein [Armatimonadota bacterium]